MSEVLENVSWEKGPAAMLAAKRLAEFTTVVSMSPLRTTVQNYILNLVS